MDGIFEAEWNSINAQYVVFCIRPCNLPPLWLQATTGSRTLLGIMVLEQCMDRVKLFGLDGDG